MTARLLTGYFPFDDIIENFVSRTGMLEHVSPIASYLNDNPLMPSGAALFVSSMIMVMDFSRPHWKPVSHKAKDFVVSCLKWCVYLSPPQGSFKLPRSWQSRTAPYLPTACLQFASTFPARDDIITSQPCWHCDGIMTPGRCCFCREPSERPSIKDALQHPWLQRFTSSVQQSADGGSASLQTGVVQKIQRFGGFSHLKRAALEHITAELMTQHQKLSAVINSLDDGDESAAATPAYTSAAAAAGASVRSSSAPTLLNVASADSVTAAAAAVPARALRADMGSAKSSFGNLEAMAAASPFGQPSQAAPLPPPQHAAPVHRADSLPSEHDLHQLMAQLNVRNGVVRAPPCSCAYPFDVMKTLALNMCTSAKAWRCK